MKARIGMSLYVITSIIYDCSTVVVPLRATLHHIILRYRVLYSRNAQDAEFLNKLLNCGDLLEMVAHHK